VRFELDDLYLSMVRNGSARAGAPGGGLMMADEPVDDVAALRAEFPLWVIGDRWSAVGSGPDGRVLTAKRGNVSLVAPTADGLRRAIRRAGG